MPSENAPRDPSRESMLVLLLVLGMQGFVTAVNSAAAPLLADDFQLEAGGVARVFGWHALGALASFALGFAADRFGRRRLLIASVAGALVASLSTAFAPSLSSFVVSQMFAQGFGGAMLGAATVILAEELPAAQRSRGQGQAGVLLALGSGWALILVALLGEVPGSWRWAWGFSAIALGLLLPLLRRALPETRRFEAARARGDIDRARFGELLAPRYRARTTGLLVGYFLAQASYTATHSWLLFHPQRSLGASALLVTAIVIGGGAVGIAGNPLGAWTSDHLGRRPTLVFGGLLSVAAGVGFYWVPSASPLALGAGLAIAFGLASLLDSARSVAFRAASTELFPTRLRGSLQGAVAMVAALSAVATQFATAALVDALGSLPLAISWIGAAALPGYLLIYWLVPESRGRELEETRPA